METKTSRRPCIHLEITNRETCLAGHFGGHPTPGVCSVCPPDKYTARPHPLPVSQWPLWARTVALVRGKDDDGIGDTVERTIGPATSDAFKSWYKTIFGKSCGCETRRAIWNTMYCYPFAPHFELAEKTFVINLARRPERLEQFREDYQLVGEPFGAVERFNAIDWKDLPAPSKGWPDTAGSFACNESHIAVLKHGLSLGAKSIMVFEDDVLFQGRKVLHRINDVPDDWEGIILGGMHLAKPPAEAGECVFRCMKTWCMHAYIVRGKLIQNLIDQMSKRIAGCDTGFAVVQPFHKVYSFSPNLVGQRSGESDLTYSHRPARMYDDAPRPTHPATAT